MELFLNRSKFETVKDRFTELVSKNEEWAEENAEVINAVTSNNEGDFVETYNGHTAQVVMEFNSYAERVEKIVNTFNEAEPKFTKMLNRCACMPDLLEGLEYSMYPDYVLWTQNEDLMYDSRYHDGIIAECNFIKKETDKEEAGLKFLRGVLDELEHVDKNLVNDHMSHMEDGIIRQRYLDEFLASFQAYVSEVEEFNTTISSGFADAVGEYNHYFPEFSRTTDLHQYADSQHAYVRPTRVDESELYDGAGMYGGDQGHPAGRFWLFGCEEDFYDWIRTMPEFEDYSDLEIHNYLKEINANGCGYVASVGVILQAYQGREEEFEAKYGIPYYNEDGEINYDQLLVMYYTDVHGRVFANSELAKESYVHDIENVYDDDSDAFKEKYGVDLYEADGETISDAAAQAIENEFDQKVANGETVIQTGLLPSTDEDITNRLDYFTSQHGDTLVYEELDTSTPLTQEEFLELTANGAVLELGAHDYGLYDSNGNNVNWFRDGGHSMTITGVAPNGEYIMSSYGDVYYFKPDDCSSYTITSYTVEVG